MDESPQINIPLPPYLGSNTLLNVIIQPSDENHILPVTGLQWSGFERAERNYGDVGRPF